MPRPTKSERKADYLAAIIRELELVPARKLRTAQRQIARYRRVYEEQCVELKELRAALADATQHNGGNGWERIAERQRIYIKSLEERMAGTWDPAKTHQNEYNDYFLGGKLRN